MIDFKLRQADSKEAAVVYPDDPAVAALRWNDLHGKSVAYTYCAQGANWMHWPGSVTFRCEQNSNQVQAISVTELPTGYIHDLFWRSAAPFFYQAKGMEALHASAVLTPGGIVAFCAVSGVGKSSLAYGLSRRGYPLWSDDAIVFDCRDQEIRAIALPTKTRISSEAQAFFASRPEEPGDRVDRDSPPPARAFQDQRTIQALFILERIPQEGTQEIVSLHRLTEKEAFLEILKHAICFSLHDKESKKRLTLDYLDLVQKIPIFRFQFKTGFEHFTRVLERIETHILNELSQPK